MEQKLREFIQKLKEENVTLEDKICNTAIEHGTTMSRVVLQREYNTKLSIIERLEDLLK